MIRIDTNAIVSIISNLGFPIVVCIALFWLVIKLNESFNSTIDKLRNTIDENTRLIDDVLDHLKDAKKGGE